MSKEQRWEEFHKLGQQMIEKAFALARARVEKRYGDAARLKRENAFIRKQRAEHLKHIIGAM